MLDIIYAYIKLKITLNLFMMTIKWFLHIKIIYTLNLFYYFDFLKK